MPKQTYTKEVLDILLKEAKATLIGEYNGGGRRTLIKFRCECGNEREKTFCLIKSAGAICTSCVAKNQNDILASGRCIENTLKAMHTKGNPYSADKVFSQHVLDECILKDNAILIGKYPYLFGTTDIMFTCACGITASLKFQDILGRTLEVRENNMRGALCDDCYKTKWLAARLETNLTRYGKKGGINITAETLQKREATSMRIYGVPSPNMAESVKEKKKHTNLMRRGVENPAQSPDVAAKCAANAKKRKSFVMPSGDIRIVQGYEPFALRDLLEMGFIEEQIVTGTTSVPKIQYTTVDGKARVHFPDIFIPHLNTLVEVKSKWTLACKSDSILAKKAAAEAQGFIYDLWCFTPKGLRVDLDVIEQILAGIDEVVDESVKEDASDSASESEDDGTAAGGAGV